MNYLVIALSLLSSLVFADEVSYSVSRQDIALTSVFAGIRASTELDFSTGASGASYALIGTATGTGRIGGQGVHDMVGVMGTAHKSFNGWAAGGHFDVYDTVPGGTAVGVNIEFPETRAGTDTIGLNIQPNARASNLIGIQLQNPWTYKYGIVAANTSWVLGMVDNCPFGMRFNEKTQRLEFFRNIGLPGELRRGFIDMNFEQPDEQFNRR